MSLTFIKKRLFKNGSVYALSTKDGFPIETTETFLPYYTKDAIGSMQNNLVSDDIGSRCERWMIGLSCMSGCPIGCKFCATGSLKKCRNLTSEEMVEQFQYMLEQNPNYQFSTSAEHKINYTRMGEPFLNIENVRKAIETIEQIHPNTHHYVSTIGVGGSDFSWIKNNITLQISLHSLDEKKRDELIPCPNKLSIKQLGQIRTKSNLKTTVNLTLVDESDFDIKKLREHFDPEFFFVKLSPINTNDYSKANNMGDGVIESINLL